MKHASHAMHDHSLAAYREEQPRLAGRAAAIVAHLAKHGPRTDRELAREMGFGENLNAVRPRITELLEDNVLMEVGELRCPVTKKTVRRVDIRRPRQEVLFS
jgi:hypothetical protein